MTQFEPEQFKYEESEERTDQHGAPYKITRKVSFQAEDIIAVIAGIVAVIFAIAMVFDKLPINGLTIGVVGCSGAGAIIAKMIRARKKGR